MSNETKQTAVDWLVDQYAKAYSSSVNDIMSTIIKQAKELEKRQLRRTYGIQFLNIDSNGEATFKPFEDYYKENYGGDNAM